MRKLAKTPVKVPPKNRYRTAKGNLTAALAIISRKGRWVQGQFLVDCDGNRLGTARSAKAVAFCALGAIQFVNGPGEKEARRCLIQAATEMKREESPRLIFELSEGNIFEINDEGFLSDEGEINGLKNVQRMFRRAIEIAQEK
jgi:hypothetical protein